MRRNSQVLIKVHSGHPLVQVEIQCSSFACRIAGLITAYDDCHSQTMMFCTGTSRLSHGSLTAKPESKRSNPSPEILAAICRKLTVSFVNKLREERNGSVRAA